MNPSNHIDYLDAITVFSKINGTSMQDSTLVVAGLFHAQIQAGQMTFSKFALAQSIAMWRSVTRSILDYAIRPPITPWPAIQPDWPLEDQE